MPDFDYSPIIKKKKDAPNERGLKSYFLIAPKSWFDALQGFNAAPANPGDTITVEGDHTFLEGKGFVEVETAIDNALAIDPVGDLGGQGFMNKFDGFYPGNDAEAAEMMSHLKDDDCVVLVPLADGQFLQLGREGLWAQVKPAFNPGTNSAGKNGWTVTVESYSGTPIYYTGSITKKPVA